MATESDLPVIVQYGAAEVAPPAAKAAGAVGLDDAESALSTVTRFVTLFERASVAMSQLLEARAQAAQARDARIAQQQPAAPPGYQPDAGRQHGVVGLDYSPQMAAGHYHNGAAAHTGTPPQYQAQPAPLPPMQASSHYQNGESAHMETAPQYQAQPAPLPSQSGAAPAAAVPAAPSAPDWDSLLTDERLDRLFAVAIDYAQSDPTQPLGKAASDLDSNRGLIRRVIRKALADS